MIDFTRGVPESVHTYAALSDKGPVPWSRPYSVAYKLDFCCGLIGREPVIVRVGARVHVCVQKRMLASPRLARRLFLVGRNLREESGVACFLTVLARHSSPHKGGGE